MISSNLENNGISKYQKIKVPKHQNENTKMVKMSKHPKNSLAPSSLPVMSANSVLRPLDIKRVKETEEKCKKIVKKGI